ncbi:hypothetical protein P8452_28394 [Trifolium repens]|nr:hypothetical protein P8452_28394 [Trifolium repens]
MPLFLSLANHNSQSQPLSFSGRHSLSLSFQLSSALNGAHREDFDGGWGSGMISLKESSIKQGIYSYNNFLGERNYFFVVDEQELREASLQIQPKHENDLFSFNKWRLKFKLLTCCLSE